MRLILLSQLFGFSLAGSLGPHCQEYLAKKNFSSLMDVAEALVMGPDPCPYNATAQQLYAPDPKPSIPGASDTTDMACRYGNPQMWGDCGVCCGLRPHFNWIVATCEATQPAGQFCKGMPECILDGSPKINYVASYQFDGEEFVLMDESSVGELTSDGIYGNYAEGTGFQAYKDSFRWRGGDWTTKYAPWRRKGAARGPRGLTPPAILWVLSAENFYYGAFYMLSQLGLNLDGQGQPTRTNCWNWELDPVEGTAGWSPGERMPGNVNMLYSTNSAQNSGCMPVDYYSSQANGFKKSFEYPKDFKSYCAINPNATGCQPWKEDISWSGGADGSQRYENLWDEPYVFAIVVDAKGYWNYRWRPRAYSPHSKDKTGWAGLGRYRAKRRLPARPAPVKDPRGLHTDVAGDVAEAVMLQPSLHNEESCLRSSIEAVDWQWGTNALAAMAAELGQNATGERFEGTMNWWNHFVDTRQNAGYPMSIAGIERKKIRKTYKCRNVTTSTCDCAVDARDAALATELSEAEREEVVTV